MARFDDLLGIDLGGDEARLLARLGDNRAPRIDDQRMAVGLASAGMSAALGRSDDVTPGLDGAGPQQDMPVRAPGLSRKCRRDGENFCAAMGQGPVKRREAEVVAHRQPYRRPGRLGEDGLVAGAISGRFAVGFAAGQIDVEHVDLVIAGDDGAVFIEEVDVAIVTFIFATANWPPNGDTETFKADFVTSSVFFVKMPKR